MNWNNKIMNQDRIMNHDKIKWCFEQYKGIKLISPSHHLSNAYIEEANETLENVSTSTGKWKSLR